MILKWYISHIPRRNKDLLVVTRSWEKYYFEHSLSNVKIRKNELIVFYEN